MFETVQLHSGRHKMGTQLSSRSSHIVLNILLITE